jgi:hypothetical protein
MRHTTVFSIFLLLAMNQAGAAMFKWTDANGNVQYGQHPPAGVDAEYLKADQQPKAGTPATPSLQEQVEALDKRLAQEAEQKAKEAQKEQDAENRKINCTNARKNLEQLNMGGHRLTRMPDGSYERLDEKQKQAEITKNQQAVKDFCD